MVEEVKQEFIPIKSLDNYEVSTTQPWNIRKIEDKTCLKQYMNHGYLMIVINGTSKQIHRIVAEQFIENSDPIKKIQVDHINRNKLDNSIENLRWVTPSENNANRDYYEHQKWEYIESLPENAIEIVEHDGIKYSNYYYDIDNERILKLSFLKNRTRIKIIKPTISNKYLHINLTDIYGKGHTYSYNKLIRRFKNVCDSL